MVVPPHVSLRLDGGVRLIVVPMRGRAAVTVSLMVGVGSRAESTKDAGLAHFIEHMVFKGSTNHPTARAISEAIEGVGGSSNAATDREATMFWAKVPAGHLEVAADVLIDMLLHPLLEKSEVEKERPVVVEEIRMYADNPQDHVHTIFDDIMWPNHPLGRDVAGTPETVMGFTAERVRHHLRRHYRPDQLVIAIAGDVDAAEVERLVVERVSGWTGPAGAVPPAEPAGPTTEERLRLVNRRAEQANIVIGARAASYLDEDRFIVDIANTILGDGMSSRLFLELREERGLAYEVYSFTNRLRDTGALCISLGCEPRNAARAVSGARAELERLGSERVADSELAKAKAYSIGRLLLHLDSTGALCNYYGQQELLGEHVMEPAEVVSRLQDVTAEDVMRVISGILAGGLRGAIVGPFRSSERLERALVPRSA